MTLSTSLMRMKQNEENMNDFDLMFAENTAIVVISGNKDT